MPDDLRRLLATGLVEEVEPDEETARVRLEEAERHLVSAGQIAATDPNGAFQLVYDAARKAVTAHMLAHGFRLTSRPGAHVTVGRYALEQIGEVFDPFDRMRRLRNRSEYGTAFISESAVADALRDGARMVEAARAALPGG